MAKSKKNPPVQNLSPESYIRQNARKLPIYECWVSADWKESGSASVCVSRIHTNGNITFAMYLVDLLCLGVKETKYGFNLPMNEYRAFLDRVKNDLGIVKIDYVLAHNIVFAAKEYADELGFKPHKSFTAVTQYLLEEDNDEVELMEINCGDDGKPMFIKTEFVSNAEAQRVITQLDKSVGKGNYEIIYMDGLGGDDCDEDDEDENEYDSLMDEYNVLPLDDKIKLFKELTCNGLDYLSNENRLKLIALTDSMFLMDLCDEEEVEDIYGHWAADINMAVDENLYSWESLGLKSEREITEEEWSEFDELDDLIDKQSKKVPKKLEKLRNKWGDIPYLDCMELNYLELVNTKKHESKLKELTPKLKGFSFFELGLYKHTVAHGLNNHDHVDIIDFDDVFEGRESVTPKEMIAYLTNKLFGLQLRGDKNELEAFYNLIDDVDLADSVINMMKTFVAMVRIHFLMDDYK